MRHLRGVKIKKWQWRELKNSNIAMWTNVGTFKGHKRALCNKEPRKEMSKFDIWGIYI